MRVLLVEDDRALSMGIQHALEREGWRVDSLADGEQAASEGLLGHYDLAVLDIGLPRKNGMDVLRHWRAHGSHMPVLLLTARDQLADRHRARVTPEARAIVAVAEARRRDLIGDHR